MTPASPHAGAPSRSSDQPRRDVAERAVGVLPVEDVVAPLGEERGHVHVQRAVGGKTWASASQPRRSSRCGQSVGTEMKLPRWPQLMLRQSWLTSASEHSNQPVRGVSVCTTRPVSVGQLVEPVHLDVAEAVEGEARLEDLVGRRPRARRCRLARAAQVVQVQRAVRLEHLGVAQLTRVPRSPSDGQPDPADHVLSEVDDVHARAAALARRPARSSSVTRIGCARSGTSGAVPSRGRCVARPARHGPGSRRASKCSPISRSAYRIGPVVGLPAARRWRHLDASRRRTRVQLAQQRGLAAVVVAAAGAGRSRRCPAYQPSPSDRAEHVRRPSRSSSVTSYVGYSIRGGTRSSPAPGPRRRPARR